MDFLIKYIAYTASRRETTIPHCPNADVALQAFKKLVDLNHIRLRRVTDILVIPKQNNTPYLETCAALVKVDTEG